MSKVQPEKINLEQIVKFFDIFYLFAVYYKLFNHTSLSRDYKKYLPIKQLMKKFFGRGGGAF